MRATVKAQDYCDHCGTTERQLFTLTEEEKDLAESHASHTFKGIFCLPCRLELTSGFITHGGAISLWTAAVRSPWNRAVRR